MSFLKKQREKQISRIYENIISSDVTGKENKNITLGKRQSGGTMPKRLTQGIEAKIARKKANGVPMNEIIENVFDKGYGEVEIEIRDFVFKSAKTMLSLIKDNQTKSIQYIRLLDGYKDFCNEKGLCLECLLPNKPMKKAKLVGCSETHELLVMKKGIEILETSLIDLLENETLTIEQKKELEKKSRRKRQQFTYKPFTKKFDLGGFEVSQKMRWKNENGKLIAVPYFGKAEKLTAMRLNKSNVFQKPKTPSITKTYRNYKDLTLFFKKGEKNLIIENALNFKSLKNANLKDVFYCSISYHYEISKKCECSK